MIKVKNITMDKGESNMKRVWFCPNCDEIIETKIIEKEETLSVKGKLITCTALVRVCAHCGEEIVDEDLDGVTLRRFYDAYRESEKLLTSADIRNIRSKYKLSQASFSKLLGFGEKTITRYENGAIQDVCHDNLIRLMQNIDAFIEIWDVRKDVLTSKENERIQQFIQTYRICIKTTYLPKLQYATKGQFCASVNGGDERYVG